MNTDDWTIDLTTRQPDTAQAAFVAGNATLVGAVTLAEGVSVWYGVVLRGDGDEMSVGAHSNIQDNSVLHTDPGFPLRVGERVTVGHQVVLHGCSVGDHSLVGMGSVVMNGAEIGRECLVAAGSVVLEGTKVPDGSLVAGLPAKVRRTLTDEERSGLTRGSHVYDELARRHAAVGGSAQTSV